MIKVAQEVVKVAGSPPRPESWITPELIQAYASAAGAVAWPITAIAVALIFRRPIKEFLSNATDIEIAGAKFKRLQQELTDAGKGAKDGPTPPTGPEQARAAAVAMLLEETPSLVVKEAEALAFEYERERASRLPGDERTRRMEVVVAKMRTIGQAVFPLRHELAASPSPGKRLQAIVALQVVPDYEMLPWLAERPAKEKPFVGYHALIALVQAARSPAASAHIRELTEALAIAQQCRTSFGKDADREKFLRDFEKAVDQLKALKATASALA
ncbi:hypothetical protein [Methylorubrum extorquens]|uniref:hypothetical protein n=1 Tax=Methylorubrum extorquens TaxID=408 RepID=UPI0020A037FF|nr:hypothetical protein [Methylorubrum extorquens]MCP1539960.1 hypothetical protein [Methylorubrum extorquens]